MQLSSAIMAAFTALSFLQTTQGYLIDPDSCTGGEDLVTPKNHG
jgi:hypothetical protein